MQNFVPALLRLTSRPTYWRIAVILQGRILWRTYSRVEYPTPDDAVRRCLAGLVGSSHQQHEPCPRAVGQNREFAPVEGHQSSPQCETGHQYIENDHAERVQGEDHKIVSCRAQSGWSPSRIMTQATATIIAIVETQMMTVSIFYPLPATYSHRQTSIPKNAATDTPNHATGSQP